jgi:hypothetical protein
LGSVTRPHEEEWLVDSGSTHHMCNTRDQFTKLEQATSCTRVVLGNSTSSKVTSVGTIDLEVRTGEGNEVSTNLREVLLVPKLRKNLISVTRLMDDGVDVHFDSTEKSCRII